MLNYSDGTNSKIYVNGSSATLFNDDGTQSIIDYNSSTLIAIDGTISTISHNGTSSTVFNSDGSQVIINHRQNTSSCFTEYGRHTMAHNFGNVEERCHKNKIDVLVYTNWMIKLKAAKSMQELDEAINQG